MTDNPRLILGLKLRNLRQERGFTLRELSERSGISISYLSEIEKGKKYPKPEKLQLLAEELSVSFDELVSLQVSDELSALKAALASPFIREFPFDLFGIDLEDLLSLFNNDPVRAAAMIRTFLELARTYDVRVEHFLFAALRSFQYMHRNYFPDLEKEATDYRARHGWTVAEPATAERLEAILVGEHGYELDFDRLAADEDLRDLRTVYRAPRSRRDRPKLHVNGGLSAEQRAFVFAREIGYLHLGLRDRAVTSSWLKVRSFEQVLSNFKASYFAGALLLDEMALAREMRAVFREKTWNPEALQAMMRRHRTTPETFFLRLSQVLPPHFGLDEIYFMRFTNRYGPGHYFLTKVLNMSRVPVPHGVGANEHYCRRWPSMQLLDGSPRLPEPLGDGDQAPILAQRSYFLSEEAEFFVLSTLRASSLSSRTRSSVSLGFLLTPEMRRIVRFWDDPGLPRVEVNLTCERCPLSAAECKERVAPPRQETERRHVTAREQAVDRLLEEEP